MRNTAERRQLILEYISDHRVVTMQEIANEFEICLRTAKADVSILACSHPIYTQQGGGGGVRAVDGWYLTHRYLREDQEALLLSLLPGLSPEDQKTMKQILTAFAKPKEEDKQ